MSAILIYNWKDIRNPLVGGAEIITFEYARRLAAEGHDVTWFCRTFTDAKPKEQIDGVTIIRRGGDLSTYREGYEYYQSLEHKPDLVIDMLNTIAWQTPLYAGGRSKVVQYVNQLAKEVWSYEMKPPLSWLGRFLEPLQLIPYRNQSVITYAQSTADDLVNWGYNKDKIFQFRLGLDHSRYKPGKKADYPLFLQVCRMARMKRPDLTVRAFAQVIKDFPQARLALVGTGPFKDEVNALVRELNLTDSVLMPDKDIWFFSNEAGDQKVRLMQEAWCFVHPSVKEGWGMVVTEAAACGTPSIATAVTGQVDSVLDRKTGILISPDPTVEELARAMKQMIIDEPARQAMSKECLKWAANFSWDKSFDLFKKALEKASGLPLQPPVKVDLPPLKKQPTISIVTPVFNAERVLDEFFAGIDQTTYPKDKIQLIMPDGGSKDKTRQLAEAHGATVLDNPLKTGEAGKAVGVAYVLHKIKKQKEDPADHLICLLDSDNILIEPDWFERMIEPFMKSSNMIGSEPWEYSYRKTDRYITRYAAMIGMSDPLTMFLGNYDRLCLLTGKWTNLPIKTIDHHTYFDWVVDSKMVPTIGANGSLFRASFFADLTIGDYLFDIDLLYKYTQTHVARFAKVKIGLVHIYCRTLHDFYRKQQRRIKDFHYFQSQGLRSYPWKTVNQTGLIWFLASCLTIVPLLWQTVKGYSKKPDPAWLFHPFACWITLWVYGSNAILNKFRPPTLTDRTNWRQG
jgi:glycosyltransferase involved in cell wall biosynthesis